MSESQKTHPADELDRLSRVAEALRAQDEVHWKTRRALLAENAALRADAERYRWLRNRNTPTHPDGMTRWGPSNRLPHIAQYPYIPKIDATKWPQVWERGQYKPENLDAAIDAALAKQGEQT